MPFSRMENKRRWFETIFSFSEHCFRTIVYQPNWMRGSVRLFAKTFISIILFTTLVRRREKTIDEENRSRNCGRVIAHGTERNKP